MERAYLLKPHQGKIDKQKMENFADLEAKNKAYVPGPHYNTSYDWSKMIPAKTG
jgi:hypothetical protein